MRRRKFEGSRTGCARTGAHVENRACLETYFITRGSLFTSARPAGSCHHELTISRYPIFAPVESSTRRSSRADSQNDLLFKRAYTRLYRHVLFSFSVSLSLSLSLPFSSFLPAVANRSIGENLTASREWNALRGSGGEQLVSDVHEN